ncbi:PAS domain-containing sensor histidine kinase [Hymenobacter antarcticus]|uniref:histidine kinase n=1 Tax=Hymenobacter antarcticus TaxID=486270 RepID=A0ABP7QQI2_9BACT
MLLSAVPALDFELLFALLPAPHGVLAPDGTLLGLNDALARLLPAGSAAALPGQPLAALRATTESAGLVLADAAAWEAGLAAAWAGEVRELLPTLRPAPAETGCYWQATLQPVPLVQPRYVVVRLLDVSEQLLAQQVAVQAAHELEQFRFLAESLPQLIWSTNAHGEFNYTNQRFIDYTGHDVLRMPPAAKQDLWQHIMHPDDLAGMHARWAEALVSEQAFELEFRMRGVDGEYRWFRSHVAAQRGADGQVRRWFGLCTDVDARHRDQLRIDTQQRLMQRILDQLPLTISTMAGPDLTFTFLSGQARQAMGPRAAVGRTVAESLPEIARQGYLRLLQQVLDTGQPLLGHEERSALVDPATGTLREHYHNFGYLPLAGDERTAPGVLAYSLDVTEQVLARHEADTLQAEVRAADARLRHLAAVLPIVTFITDGAGRTMYISPQWYAYTGQAAGGPWAEVDTLWPDTVHPDDQAGSARLIQESIATAQVGKVELRLRRHDGQYRWFMTVAVPELDASGQLVRRHGYLLDVHELHERTRELARSRADFAALADNIAQLAWMADATGHIFWYNQQWYDFTGSTLEAMQDWGWIQVHDPTLVTDVNARYLAAIQAGQPWEDTFPLRRHDGQFRWFLSRARPIRDASGAVVRWFGTNTDVTELRELQQRLTRSEEELRIQAESLPQQVWTARPDGTVDFYNHRTAAYVGESMEKNGAAHWLSFVHPDDLPRMQERWQAAIASQRYYEAEFRLRRYDGQYRWFLGQAQARRDPGGQVLKWYGTNTDVDQQRQLQEQVLASQSRFQQLLETLPQMAWTTNPDGNATYYSQRWYAFTGATFEQLRNWGWEQLVHPDDLLATLSKWGHSLATGEAFEDETRWRDQHGDYRWFLVRGEPIRDKSGAISVWVGAHTDIHEFKQIQQQLEAQNARLTRTNEDLDNFIYTASHDLKQPITNMAGIFEELTRTAYFRDPDAIKLITYFERALARIYGTIDDLSAIVQVQRQQQELPAEAVALAPLADEVLSSLQDQVRQLGATFELDFTTCPAVDFVRPHLQSVFFNLISNSLKYAAPGRPPSIRLSSAPDLLTGRPIITVQDNGLGIDLERFGPQLFQLFRRFHSHVEGTGMGLYLINRIVQNHGGRLEVSSAVDEGTTFRIHL